MKCSITAILPLLLGLPTLAPAAVDPKASYREWQTYPGDYGGSHYSELDQINRTNVKQLQLT